MDIGERIKLLREKIGMSQAELAKKANIAQSSISYIESGGKSPSLETIDNTGKAISREKLIEKLRRDAENLKSDSASMKEIVRQYISKVEIADDTVTICAIGDLNTSGCGGAQYDVFKFTFNRLTVFVHSHSQRSMISLSVQHPLYLSLVP